MSHQFVEGFFSNNEPAWHGLGKVLPTGVWPGREEAMKLAGHDWKVLERPVYAAPFNNGGTLPELPDYKALFDDRGNTLSVVSRDYGVIQNDVPYDLIEAVAAEGIKWHCGMTLQRGQCVVVGYLPEAWTAPGDNSPTLPFITATWAHDGVTAFKLLRSSIRVVCANTKAAAESEARAAGLSVTIRHTKNWQEYVDRARLTLKGLRQGFEEYKELARELASIAVTDAQVTTFLSQFLPMPEPETGELQVSERVRDNVHNARLAVDAILSGVHGTTPDAHRRTAYGLWQSGLEYLQHSRPARTAYSRFGRSVLREEKAAANLHRLVLAVAK